MGLMIGSNVILSFFLAGILQLLWGAINVLQIIVFTILFNVMMPYNVETVMKEIMKFTNLDLINPENLL